MNPFRGTLPQRVGAQWRQEGWPGSGARVVVALSGGADSSVLLHLLRFSLPQLELDVVAAHLDHAMRPESAADAAWVRGLTGAWQVPLRSHRLEEAPSNEARARSARYSFLTRVMEDEGAVAIVTAHHLDDQAETVLYRIARGTGVRGLGGLPARRDPGVIRPLLTETREAIVDYARRHGVGWLRDPTNEDVTRARNRLRHRVLPELERVHPGVRRSLARLARNAQLHQQALDELLEPRLAEVVLADEPEGLALDRPALLALPRAVGILAVRALARRVGVHLDAAGTATAMEFITTGRSGAEIHLPHGARLYREFETVHLVMGPAGTEPSARGRRDEALVVPGPHGRGGGTARVAGFRLMVRWGDRPFGSPEERWTAFDPAGLEFPVQVRSWQPGDRTRGTGGSRKLKKLLAELRVPRSERKRLPVVVDGREEVVWIPGWYRAPVARPRPETNPWYLGIWNDDEDA
jgi:tRNA(Ile)-lysidine synthase